MHVHGTANILKAGGEHDIAVEHATGWLVLAAQHLPVEHPATPHRMVPALLTSCMRKLRVSSICTSAMH